MHVGPAGITYTDLTGIENYGSPGAVVIVSLFQISDPRVKAVADEGAIVLAYQGFMERPPRDLSGNPDDFAMYGDGTEGWDWGGGRSNFPGTVMTNVRRGSSWGIHYLEFLTDFLARYPWLRGCFYDVYGERLWTAVWNEMTPTERSEWTNGMDYHAPLIREVMGDRWMICNNTPSAIQRANFDGMSIENHPPSNIPFFTGVLNQPDWRRDLHLYIARRQDWFDSWLNAAHADDPPIKLRWITHQLSGYASVGPVWGPFTADPNGTAPPPEDCAECEAALADMTAQRDQAVAERDAIAAEAAANRQTLAEFHQLLLDSSA